MKKMKIIIFQTNKNFKTQGRVNLWKLWKMCAQLSHFSLRFSSMSVSVNTLFIFH